MYGIAIFVDGLFLIASLYIGIAEPKEFIDDFHSNQVYSNWGNAKKELRIAYFVLAFILLIVIGLLFYAFIVFHKARKYLAENPRRCSLFPDTFIGRRPIHYYGFYNNSPKCSQNSTNQQMPAPAYTVHNSQQFYSSEIVNPPPSIGAGVVVEVKPPKY
uniref:Uncharacterized protein n=1 Tax=Panagrolaimus davidi TaxID=227884 RepID=A0A914P0G4_9BILA